jgi:catechol 2,3-dioxygenase-like lactoylglutathione lyase family enzyme
VAQERPAIWGVAKTTFLVSNMEQTRAYYKNFLGFDEAFSYPSAIGTVVSFKVSDRQFLEFVEDRDAGRKNRLVSFALETSSVEQMRTYLQSLGVAVPDKTSIDGAGNKVILVKDNDNNPIEFIEFSGNGLHRKSKGKHLSPDRIAKRIHHIGIYTKVIDEQDPFWVKTLKCRELVRYPVDKDYAAVLQYLSFGNSTESIEHYSPNESDVSHPCFLTDDMQETIYTLKERPGNYQLANPSIGKGNRWILNIRDPDNNRIEFTEAFRLR